MYSDAGIDPNVAITAGKYTANILQFYMQSLLVDHNRVFGCKCEI